MTEFNPFSTNQEPSADAPEQGEQVEDGGAGGRKAVIALGALAGVALAGGAFFFLSSGDDSADDFAPVARAARPAAAAPAPAASAKVKLPAQSRVTLGRNPFRALYVEPAPEPPPAPAAPAAGAPTSTGGGTVPIVVVGAGGNSVPPTGTGTGTAPQAPPQQPAVKEHKLVLLRVFGAGKDQSASFSIDGKQQTAKVGTTFGPSAEILLLSLQQGPKDDQWTAVLQVGDGDPFDVVTGEPVFVR